MRGVYLVAAELCRIGLIASPTSRSAKGADILATDQSCSRAWSVQVKTNAKTFSFWLLNARTQEMCSEHHVYVLVNLLPEKPEYFIVPSHIVADRMVIDKPTRTRSSTWYSIYRERIEDFKEDWDFFKRPSTAAPA
jgi:hypothetical protein